MSLPKQTVGLTNFYGSIKSCPPNPDSIKAIVFTVCDNLAVINGASTEIKISLQDFFIPIEGAARITFPVHTNPIKVPLTINKLNLGGVDTSGDVKFIAIFPDFGTGASAGELFLEWTSTKSIEDGELTVESPLEPTGNTSFNFNQINELEFSWGGYLDYDNNGGGTIYAATNGGLFSWNGNSAKLFNTLNSNLDSDYLNSIDVESNGNIWIGSNTGVSVFNPGAETFISKFTTSNTSLSSNIINDIEVFNDSIAIATNLGLSVCNTNGENFKTYNVYNSPLLKHKAINTVKVLDNLIFAGTTGGVYCLDNTTKHWAKYPLNSTNINGWTAPDNVQDIALYNDAIYVGTTGGLVILPYIGLTGATSSPITGLVATTISLTGASGPYSSNFKSLRIEKYGANYQLYIGHGQSGGISIYDITDDQWIYSNNFTELSNGVNDVLPDYLSGKINKTLFSGNDLTSLFKIDMDNNLIDTVPGIGDVTDILLSIPGSTSSGNYFLNNDQLYSVDQSFWMLFSKPVEAGNVLNYISLNKEIDGSGNLIPVGTDNWGDYGVVAYVTGASGNKAYLERASGYNFKLAMGLTANDSSFISSGINVGFYTQNIDPILGWNKLGKMLVLSGSNNNLIDSVYLRNPQAIDINVIALIGN